MTVRSDTTFPGPHQAPATATPIWDIFNDDAHDAASTADTAVPAHSPAPTPGTEPSRDSGRQISGEDDLSVVASDRDSLALPPGRPIETVDPGTSTNPDVLAIRHRMRNARKSTAPDLFEKAKAELSIHDAWHALDLPGTPGQSCRSPFRNDRNPSFSVYDEGRKWKDHGTGEGGDVIGFILMALGDDYSDVRDWLMERLDGETWTIPRNEPPGDGQESARPVRQAPDLSMRPGSDDELQQLADLRDLSMRGVRQAQRAGVLGFTNWCGRLCYVITDTTRRASELRALDGGRFMTSGDKPSKAAPVPGVDKSWLPGVALLRDTSPDTSVLLVEGATDLLTAFDLYADYRGCQGGEKDWVPVALLGAGCKCLDPECAELIKGRHVRIVADGDDAGDKMKIHWARLLHELGCTVDSVGMPRGNDLSDIADEIDSTNIFS